MEYTIYGSCAEITLTSNVLRIFEENGLTIWHTPDSTDVYAAREPRWRDDYRIATPEDFLIEYGYDSSEGLEESLTIVVDL